LSKLALSLARRTAQSPRAGCLFPYFYFVRFVFALARSAFVMW
jgi:hypothetical protein